MNRALLALLGFALLFAAGLVWMRVTLPAPELPATPEMLPADVLFYAATRRPHDGLSGVALERWPQVRAALAGLPIQALALAVFPVSGNPPGWQALVLAESAEPERLEAALRAALPPATWREQQHGKRHARWSTFHRDGQPVLGMYRGRATFAVSLGETPLARRLGEKRHGAPALADRPDFQFRARTAQDQPLLVWSDREPLARALTPFLHDPRTPGWALAAGAEIARLGAPLPATVPSGL